MRNSSDYEFAIEIFRNNNGILRMSEAVRKGIPRHILYAMLAIGLISKEARGLYSLTDESDLSNPDFVKISLLVPKAIICLTSALYFYNLTTQIPSAVNIALPRNIRVPRIAYPPIDVIRLSSSSYMAGIDIRILDGINVKIYSPEKTLADCFKYKSKIGIDIAIEALKDYMKNYPPKIDKVIEYARINRVEKIMHPYLETVI